ncbi:hypothetical protein RUND412_007944 [Rhizina undulata]
MPTLDPSSFNKVCSVAGGFIILFGLVSYLCKETLYLSETLVSLVVGVVVSKPNLGWIDPLHYTNGSVEDLERVTMGFTRLVLGIQLVIAGVQLPERYLLKEWKSLAILLGPVMFSAWAISSVIIWAVVPQIPFLHALAIAACITPTDPILANSIVKGKFADEFIAPRLQKIIIAESGTNDGLGYPFLFVALYAIKYANSPATAVGMWFGETILYVVVGSIVYGFVVGLAAVKALKWAEERKWVDRESFLVFAIALALFITGTCGMFGSDDVLACFVAGNVFTHDDWFRVETADDSIQPTVDLLLNLSVFVYFGAVIPYKELSYIASTQLLTVAVLILLFRRLPAVLLLQRWIPAIDGNRQAMFAGYFGPIGVSAVFYLCVILEFTKGREDLEGLRRGAEVIVWGLVAASVVVHGITVPIIKLGLNYQTRRDVVKRSKKAQSNVESRDRGRVGERFSDTPPPSPGVSGNDGVQRLRGIGSLEERQRLLPV